MSESYGGYTGKLLFVDLTSQKIIEESLGDQVYRDFLGGYGLGCRVIYSRQKPKADPLASDGLLGFVTGCLTGTPAITGARFSVVGKSPLTGTWGDSNAGGYFGPTLKSAGYDGVFFSGISEEPVYLLIENSRSKLKHAGKIWGKDSIVTESSLKSEFGKKAVVACIGQAGENLSLISGIVTDGGRICARSGLGAIMGAKKLKAVVVIGDMPIPMKSRKRAHELRKKYLHKIEEDPIFQEFHRFGTCLDTPAAVMVGETGIKNWKGTAEDYSVNIETLGGESIVSHQIRRYGCYGCPISCGGIIKNEGGPYGINGETHKPEYESLAALGPMCLNPNVESLIKLNHLCNMYGLDTISTGGTLAFAMECYEKELITKRDTGDIDLSWGNPDSMIAMVEMMAKREGFGAVLADGSKKAAERIGRGAEEFSMDIQGEGFPMHDMRKSPGYVVPYSQDAAPGRHTRGSFAFIERFSKFVKGLDLPQNVDKYNYNGRGEWAAKLHNIQHVVDCSGLCYLGFLILDYNSVPDFMNAIIGWNYNLSDLFKVGERISNIRQAFNIREGLNPVKFRLPDRVIGIPPLEKGNLAKVSIDVEQQVKDFLKAHDWDTDTGKPSKKKLIELGLDDVAEDLYPT